MRIANTKNPRAGTLERRVPRARCRRDITCQTQTPVAPGADGTVLALRDLVKVRRIEAGVPLAVQTHDARDLRHRSAAGRGLLPPSIPQAVIARCW